MVLTISMYYIFTVSCVLFVMMYIDKKRARNGEWRISEKTLLSLALLGGASGGMLGMYTFRHKTKHSVFVYSMPVFACMHIAIIVTIYLKEVNV